MNAVIMPDTSAGSNHTGASEMWTPQVSVSWSAASKLPGMPPATPSAAAPARSSRRENPALALDPNVLMTKLPCGPVASIYRSLGRAHRGSPPGSGPADLEVAGGDDRRTDHVDRGRAAHRHEGCARTRAPTAPMRVGLRGRPAVNLGHRPAHQLGAVAVGEAVGDAKRLDPLLVGQQPDGAR